MSRQMLSQSLSLFLTLDAVVQWTMHPWERDARMARKALKEAVKHMAYSLNLHAPDHQTSSWELGEHTSPSTVNPSRKTLLAELKASNARILTTRSKSHLVEVFKCYYDDFDKDIAEDLGEESGLKDTIYCLCAAPVYFSKDIAEEYNKQYGTPLAKKIEDVALGNYKDS
ncbi:hypothetical protein CK203_110662 [Vitis vinifera]|uniref:Uncharacterized protein n=1 Tax=Vitis vinifera TaxID=29760 RepID=A0A438D920_VITVI|nr:hypothetical protein CK203_110662 [Vitis vinifera]